MVEKKKTAEIAKNVLQRGICNGPFRSYLGPLFQNESSEFDLHENEPVGATNFLMNGFAAEPKGNSEIAY